MGDRANIFLVAEAPANTENLQGIYLYTHWRGYEWPEALREALDFGRGRWNDDQYLGRIIASRVFSNLVDSETGGGLSLSICDNSYAIIVCDLHSQTVSFAPEGQERNRASWTNTVSFEEYVGTAGVSVHAFYPNDGSDE